MAAAVGQRGLDQFSTVMGTGEAWLLLACLSRLTNAVHAVLELLSWQEQQGELGNFVQLLGRPLRFEENALDRQWRFVAGLSNRNELPPIAAKKKASSPERAGVNQEWQRNRGTVGGLLVTIS